MDRLRMPSAMPAELAERLSDRCAEKCTAKDLAEAREEMLDTLLRGETVGQCSLRDILDSELNDNYEDALDRIAMHFIGIDTCDCSSTRVLEGGEWMRELCNAWLDRNPEVVKDRAAELASYRLEDV